MHTTHLAVKAKTVSGDYILFLPTFKRRLRLGGYKLSPKLYSSFHFHLPQPFQQPRATCNWQTVEKSDSASVGMQLMTSLRRGTWLRKTGIKMKMTVIVYSVTSLQHCMILTNESKNSSKKKLCLMYFPEPPTHSVQVLCIFCIYCSVNKNGVEEEWHV